MTAAIVFLLVFTRIMAMVMTAPLLGNRVIPFKIRLGIGLLLSLATVSLIPVHAGVPTQGGAVVGAIVAEAIIGSLLGLGVMLLFSAAQMVGTMVGQMAGIQMADSQDPNSGSPSTSVARLMSLVSIAVFVVIGGPELLVTSVLDTFVHVPLGTELNPATMIETTALLLQQSFLLTLRGVAPSIGAMMVGTISIGLIGRAYPQMNMLQVGLGSNLVVMLLAISLTLGGCVWLFVDDLGGAIQTIQNAISQPAEAMPTTVETVQTARSH